MSIENRFEWYFVEFHYRRFVKNVCVKRLKNNVLFKRCKNFFYCQFLNFSYTEEKILKIDFF